MSADLFADPDVRAAMNRRQPRRGGRRSSGNQRDKTGEQTFRFHCHARGLPKLETQYVLERSDGSRTKHDKPRVWRFDFAWPQHKLIVEIDGGIWVGGAHAHPIDLTRNMAKRNDAALAGFLVIAFTPDQVKKGEAIQFTIRVLAARGWEVPK